MIVNVKDKIKNRLKNWYLPLITGVVFIIMGIWVMATPIGAFLTLAVVFSFGFMLSGFTDIIHSISSRKEIKSWGWYLILGILTFILGIHLMLRPGLTAIILCYYIAFWLLFRSIMHIGNAIDLKEQKTKNWGWVLALGILGVLFSIILLWNPTLTSIATSFWISFGLISIGLVQVVLGFGLRKIKKKINSNKRENDIQELTDYEIITEKE